MKTQVSQSQPRIVLITGMSGAGKSVALKTLEDTGYEAMDNIPLSIVPEVVKSCDESHQFLAIGIDIRNRDFSVKQFQSVVSRLKEIQSGEVQTIFLDADSDVLRARFSETRRRHPLLSDRPVVEGITYERELVRDVKAFADVVLDTSDFAIGDLRRWMREYFTTGKTGSLTVIIRSFSFRYGIPRDADLLFDVRFLQNPYYRPELKEKTGLESDVQAYVTHDPVYTSFFENLSNMLLLLLPRYQAEGKSYLTIAVGCTGGRHRSVTIAEKLFTLLKEYGSEVFINHRDL